MKISIHNNTISDINHKIDQILFKLGLKSSVIPSEVIELPNMLQPIILNLRCGASIDTTIKRMLENHDDGPAYIRLKSTLKKEENAIIALSIVAKQIDHAIFWRFTQLLEQYHITGSAASIDALEYFYKDLWLQKQTAVKTKSERVSIMLTFLLMLSFCSVIIVITAPILMSF